MVYSDSQEFPPSPIEHSSKDLLPALGIDSTLSELPLHTIQLSLEDLGTKAAQIFQQMPSLPGILLISDDNVSRVLSRHRFLEFLLLPQGFDLFLSQPLHVLYSYARLEPLTLPHDTSILVATQAALQRPLELQEEPILVTEHKSHSLLNFHDLNRADWQIRGIETQIRYERIQTQMLQNQKMSALGRLVDGVAHEMLDPLGFIWGNLAHIAQYCQEIITLIEAYENVLETEAIRAPALTELKEDIELEYLKEDLPNTIRSVQGGANRLKRLASSLQNFCHIDEVYPKPADLHEMLDSIVLLIKSRLTTRIEFVQQYTPLPPITCFAGQLGQVFMNILTYCVDALLEHTARQNTTRDLGLSVEKKSDQQTIEAPQIMITTRLCSVPDEDELTKHRWVSITIADNGPGLTVTAQQQILDTFSIKQRLDRETDLAASYRIVTAKHGGKLYLRSRQFSGPDTPPGIGTEFEIQLPLHTSSK
ncbi:MAG: ATP-binding protein [Cyanobacteria bacterium J06639_14]